MTRLSADGTAAGHPQVLHVVNISFVIPYYLGGLTEFLSERGVRSHVACSPAPDLPHLAHRMGFQALSVPVLREISPATDLRSILTVARYVRRHRITRVVGHTPKGGLIAAVAGRLGGAERVVYVRHGLVFETQTGWRRRLVVAMDRLTSRLSHRVISVSPSVRDTAHALRLNPPSKSLLLGRGSFNGVDTDRFAPASGAQRRDARRAVGLDPDALVIGYVGRLVNDKGIPELVQAWHQVSAAHPRAVLLLVGPPEDRDAVEPAVLTALERDPRVVTTGLVGDTAPLYRAMDLFVLPSRREGLPTVVLEASASGLPVVTTSATGCRDVVVDGSTGRLVPLTADALAESLITYLDDPEMRARDGSAGRAFVMESFDRRVLWQQFLDEVVLDGGTDRTEAGQESP